MKRIIVAKTGGFCLGVKRAVEMTLKLLAEVTGPVYMYGVLIHNPQVSEMLHDRGVIIINKEKIPDKGTVVVRAHGITPETEMVLRQSGINIVDATCPFVTKVQKIITNHIAKGYYIIIVGDQGHAEVESYLGYAENKGIVVTDTAALQDVPSREKYCVVAQTTQDAANFRIIVREFKKRLPDRDIVIHNTICHATSRRQLEAAKIASRVDAIIVIGGKNSANTRRLVEKCRLQNCPTFFLERAEELPLAEISQYETIGITAGASTPQWVISEVIQRLTE